jgi:HEAT repeat protein
MLDEATTLLKSKKVEERLRAVRMLRRDGSAGACGLLLKALQDRTHYVAAQAAEALGEIGNDDTAMAMTDRFLYLCEDGLKRDPGCHVRAQLALALAHLRYHPASRALEAGIRTRQIEAVGGVPFDTGAMLRANCALAMAQLRLRDALRDISLLLFDRGDNAVDAPWNARPITTEPRKAAAQALAILADPVGALPLTLKLTFPNDEAPDVLQECMQALVALEDERAVELLSRYLEHPDRHLAAFAAVMLAQTRAPEVTEILRRAIPQFTGDPLRAILLALTAMRTEEAQALLRLLADDSRPEVRNTIAEIAPEAAQ